MRITLQGNPRDIPKGSTLQQLLAHLDLHPATCLIEHNGHVPPRDQWPTTTLQPGDNIEVFRVAAGG